MLDRAPSPFPLVILGFLTCLLALGPLTRGRLRTPPRLRYLWILFLLLTLADWVSFRVALWSFAAFSFLAVREFFSLVDIRLQDRWGILGAYLSILFMIWFIHINWYGMFIISIPVYTFLLIPFLVALGGGEPQGTVFSIGVIDLGLFLFVYCMGHIAYLAFFSVRMAMLLVVGAAFSDLVYRKLAGRRPFLPLSAAAGGTVLLALSISPWTTIPPIHSVVLGLLIPLLVFGGNFTLRTMKSDLGVTRDRLEPGRGLMLDSLYAFLFPAPVAFHYLRWFLDWGRL
jgi:phosphatidate cytidylyltransferase